LTPNGVFCISGAGISQVSCLVIKSTSNQWTCVAGAIYSSTSYLPGRLLIAPAALVKKFVNVLFIKFASSLATRPSAVSPALRYVRYVARAASAVTPVPFINRMIFSKSAILHLFLNFYTLTVDIFRIFPIKSTYDPYEPSFVEIGPHVFSKSGTQTHRQTEPEFPGNFII